MRRILPWIVGVIVVTVNLGSLYVVAQQLDRLGANDAGQRLASQLADQLRAGIEPTPTLTDRVDLASSLAPFFVVYSEAGVPQSGTGYLDGTLAQVPVGVVSTAVHAGSDSVTWQPTPGLRFATVAVHAGNRVVLAGQSLAPSEHRTDSLGVVIVAAWLGGIALLAIGAVLQLWLTPGRSGQTRQSSSSRA